MHAVGVCLASSLHGLHLHANSSSDQCLCELSMSAEGSIDESPF